MEMTSTHDCWKSLAVKRRARGPFFWGRKQGQEKVNLDGGTDSTALQERRCREGKKGRARERRETLEQRS